jgi:hypothetical protein
MRDRSWENLELFVRNEARISSKIQIRPEMTVEGDLGQQGDDADIFMQRFFEFFDIDSGDYDFHRYFLWRERGFYITFLSNTYFGKNTLQKENR